MTRWLSPLLASAALLAAPVPAQAKERAAMPAAAASLPATIALNAIRLALRADTVSQFAQAHPAPMPSPARGSDRYGPFRVVAWDRVELVGATDRATPSQFAAMVRAFPGIRRIDMVDCPGTHDDVANLKLGRMIRASGIETHVPAHGSVRSGAVDLFLAGRERRIDNGAEFAVHSWRDPQGREARDFPLDAAPNRNYLDYYRDMGMDPAAARAFYAFTNSVPHSGARWLQASEMRGWIARTTWRGATDRRMALAIEATRVSSIEPVAQAGRAKARPRNVSALDASAFARLGLPHRRSAGAMLDLGQRL